METVISFNFRVSGLNGSGGLSRIHWTKKKALATKYQWVVKAATSNRHQGKVGFELTRYSTGVNMDYDNLVSTGKGISDAIVKCGVIMDDNPSIIVERKYSQVRVKGKENQKTVIRIWDIE